MVTAAVLPPLQRSPGQEREEAWETESAPYLGDRVILSSPFPIQFPSVMWGVEGPPGPCDHLGGSHGHRVYRQRTWPGGRKRRGPTALAGGRAE